MSTTASVVDAPEKERWWLVGVSIIWQQLMFAQLLIMSFTLKAPAAAVVIIWLMSFALPLAYLSPVSLRAYLKSSAKVGWSYVLAALVAALCGVFSVAFHHGDLSGAKLP